jgi:single-strand DNA-binding protein
MNIHMIHGRLVRDPEFTTGSEPNKDRCKFTVAADRRYGDEADFFDCTVFGKRAQVIDKYFSKGSEIVLSGEGQIRSYEDKNGVKRKAYSIIVADFDFCGSKSDAPKQTEPEPNFEEVDEDIPF